MSNNPVILSCGESADFSANIRNSQSKRWSTEYWLRNLVVEKDFKFKYFITFSFYKAQAHIINQYLENRFIKKVILDFFYPNGRKPKDRMRIWFFNEVHTDPDSRHFGGFHRHLLVEDIPSEQWRTPSKRMERFLSEHDAEALFTALSAGKPTDTQKIALLKRVLRLHPSVPNGTLGVDVKKIPELNGVLGYCLKQAGRDLSIADVVDLTASDMDLTADQWNERPSRQKALSC